MHELLPKYVLNSKDIPFSQKTGLYPKNQPSRTFQIASMAPNSECFLSFCDGGD